MTNAQARPGLLEFLLGALTAFGALSIDMYLPAFPRIAADYGVASEEVGLTLGSFFAGLAVGQLALGPVLERFGRRRPLQVGLLVYCAASVGCALAPSLQALTAWRVLQGLGAAAALVTPRAVVRDLYAGVDVARTMSRLMAVMGVAPILAPFLGGLLLHDFGWRSIFGVLAILSAASLVGVQLLLPETAPSLETRRSSRLVPQLKALFSDRQFLLHSGVVGFAMAGMFAYIAASPFVYIGMFQVPPDRFGLFFGLNALGLIGASQLNRRLLLRFGAVALLRSALRLAVGATGCLIAFALTGAAGLWGIALSLFAYLFALGGITPNGTALGFEHQAARAGLAAAVMGSTQFGLAALSSGLVGRWRTGTALPMACVMAVCALMAMALSRAARSTTAVSDSAPDPG